jgi:membrane fusion protein (multidrug efflux system)
LIALGGFVAWTFGARIPLLKVSTQGRIEPHNAVHRIEPPEPGRVVRSLLELDKEVSVGDLLIEFDAREQRLELVQNNATSTALSQDLVAVEAQIAGKQQELSANQSVDEASLREAAAKEQELIPRRKLAAQRDQLAQNSPSGSTSELEKMERHTDVEELEHSSQTLDLGLVRLRREHIVRREALTAQLLGLKRDGLKIEGQLSELQTAIERLKYQIDKKQLRAPVAGRLVDVVELAAGDYVTQGQRLGTILATGSSRIRVRARFPKETVGIVRPGQSAQLKLDGYPWTIYGTVPAEVRSVGTEPGIVATPEAVPGTVRVELELHPPADPRIELQHGLTATVEIEVARVSPAALLMRAIGEWHYAALETPEAPAREPQVAEAEAR